MHASFICLDIMHPNDTLGERLTLDFTYKCVCCLCIFQKILTHLIWQRNPELNYQIATTMGWFEHVLLFVLILSNQKINIKYSHFFMWETCQRWITKTFYHTYRIPLKNVLKCKCSEASVIWRWWPGNIYKKSNCGIMLGNEKDIHLDRTHTVVIFIMVVYSMHCNRWLASSSQYTVKRNNEVCRVYDK